MKTPQQLGLPSRFTAWRPGQGEMVEKITFSQEKFFLLDAPTGTGKSLIGIAVHRHRLAGKDSRGVLARLSGQPESDFKDKCIYLTRTKQLQDQILCIDGHTKVLTADLRWVEASTVKVGDNLVGFDENIAGGGNRRKWRNSVVKTIEPVLRPTFRLTFDDGLVIICSAEHLWLVHKATGQCSGQRWIRTLNMRPASSSRKYATKISRLLPVWKNDNSYEAGFLAAAFDGEGSLVQQPDARARGADVNLIYSQAYNAMLEKTIAFLDEKGIKYRRSISAPKDVKHSENHLISISGRPNIFRFLGQMRPPRLLDKFDPGKMGAIFNFGRALLVSKELLGMREMLALGTSTKTFLAEGLGSHNSEFPMAKTLKGRSNYPCAKHPDEFPEYTAEDCTAGSPSACRNKKGEFVSCAYYNAKREAVRAPLVVLNSSYYLTEVNGPGQFKNADLVIIDEIDSMESDLMNHIQFQVTTTQLARYNLDLPRDPHSLQGWLSWAGMVEIAPALDSMNRQLSLLPEDNWTDVEIKLNRQTTQLRNFWTKLMEFLLEADSTWLFSEVTRDTDTVFTFKPVRVRAYAARYLWDHAKGFLGMSGTILDPKIMADDMGIDDWAYALSECPFPLHHRPIYYNPVVNLTRKTMDAELPKLAQAVLDIMNAYPNDKILVHTTSFAIRDYLLDWISDGRRLPGNRLVTHSTANRDQMLSQFKRSRDPLVMLSPSFDRGVDLRDDFCRCVIICKVPYISMGDPRIRARMKLPGGDRWYLLKAIQTIIQMSGRGVRSELDYCDTWILDRQFGSLRQKMGKAFPSWWLESIKKGGKNA